MKLFYAVAASSLLSIGATLLYQKYSAPAAAPAPRKKKISKEIIDEQLARNIAFLGAENVDKIRQTKVAVIGLGGVGSWAATMLVRSGFGHVKLVDFDQVTLSSLNRHACATLEDVGVSKVECLTKYLGKIAPWVTLEPFLTLWTKDRIDILDGVDYVVDCIDNVDTKVDLLEYCVKQGIPVISSMGASTKADPRRIEISDISNTAEDPLSKVCRVKLRKRGVASGVTCIFSSEKPGPTKLLELDETQVAQGSVDELSVLKGFRVRTLPVLGPIPAIFGLSIATHLINTVGEYTSVYDPVQSGTAIGPRVHGKQFQSMMRRLRTQLERCGWLVDGMNPLDAADVDFCIAEVWKHKSLDGGYGQMWVSVWDPDMPKDVHNLVPLSRKQLDVHEKEVLGEGKSLGMVYSKEQIERVAKRRELGLYLDKWR